MIDIAGYEKKRKLGRFLLLFTNILTPVMSLLIDISSKEPNWAPQWLDLLLIKAVGIYVLIISGLLMVLANHLAKSPPKSSPAALQAILNGLQSKAFPNHQTDLNDHHRVTIFKYHKWSWSKFSLLNLRQAYRNWKKGYRPSSGWLVPFLRSGHTGKQTSVVFCAPDTGTNCEGIAGNCWASQAPIVELELPNITSSSSSANINKYVKRGKMPEEMVRDYIDRNRPLARNIMAFPLRRRTGGFWGVLVLDSVAANGINEEMADHAFHVIAATFGELLEEM